MSDDVQAFAQVMAVIVFSLAGLVAVVLGGRILWRFGNREKIAPPALDSIDSERLARVEHAVEAIAIEVERISEAQRYTVNLLGDRASANALPASTPDRDRSR